MTQGVNGLIAFDGNVGDERYRSAYLNRLKELLHDTIHVRAEWIEMKQVLELDGLLVK
ncbi:hypothetical protein I8J29_26285 [Paenibacillus sp. MWE-103]|uniref:Uncharacterized protein n=1 Tax=Paenibacillus artemisiicola TaxID=1172618 RepID=A0ABS3WHD1_9BACL|nr:hypothetical protein [Paenibacillus artemisiicola]MBO7747702.1 hypothetical protein [Paenibacillus artemisiicola]